MARKVRQVASSKFAKALLSGPRHTLRVFEEDFGPSGKRLAQQVLEYQDRYHELAGKWKNELQQALDFVKTAQQRKDLVDVLEDASLAGATDADTQLAAATIRRSLVGLAAGQRLGPYEITARAPVTAGVSQTRMITLQH